MAYWVSLTGPGESRILWLTVQNGLQMNVMWKMHQAKEDALHCCLQNYLLMLEVLCTCTVQICVFLGTWNGARNTEDFSFVFNFN